MRPERSLRYLLFSLSLLSASAFAQSVMIVDGSCQVQLSTSTVNPAARVDPLSGNLLVTSENGINCSGASVSLSAPASAVLTGSTFDISWSSTGASSCSMSGGGGTAWAGTGRLPNGTLNLTAPIAPGIVAFDISCATGAAPVTDTVQVEFQNAPTVNLTSSAANVPVGTPFTMSWVASGATACTPSGGAGTSWASLGGLPISGSVQLTAPASPAGDVPFQLTCATSMGTVSDTELVSFTQGVDCSGETLPAGINSLAQRTWSTEYGGQFPLVYSANRIFSIGTGTGLRIAITPTVPAGETGNGTLTFNEFGGEARAGFMTISRCPGDFRVDALNTPAGCTANCVNRCHTGAEAQGLLSLSFRSTSPSANVCNLTPGETYYVNIHFGSTSTPGPDGSYCSGASCRIIGGTQRLFLREAQALQWLNSGDLLGIQPKGAALEVIQGTGMP